jgi:hypothetical protein
MKLPPPDLEDTSGFPEPAWSDKQMNSHALSAVEAFAVELGRRIADSDLSFEATMHVSAIGERLLAELKEKGR